MYFCRLTRKLALPGSLHEQPIGFLCCVLDDERKSATASDPDRFSSAGSSSLMTPLYDVWSLNTISSSKKLMLGCKPTTPQSHDFTVTTTHLQPVVWFSSELSSDRVSDSL